MKSSVMRLVALTVISLALIAVLHFKYKHEDIDSKPLLSNISETLKNLESIGIQTASQNFNVILEDGNWVVPALSNYPADTNKIRQVALSLTQLQTVGKMTALPKNHAKIGLQTVEDATSQATLLTLNGNKALLLGNIANNQQYVRRSAESQAWLIEPAIPAYKKPIDWVSTQIIDVAPQGVKAIKVIRNGKEKLSAIRPTPADSFIIKGYEKVDASKLTEQFSNMLQNLQFEDVKPLSFLTSPADSLLVVDTFDEIKLDISLHQIPDTKEMWATLSARHYGNNPQNAKFAALVNQRGQWAYKLSAGQATNLTQSVDNSKK